MEPPIGTARAPMTSLLARLRSPAGVTLVAYAISQAVVMVGAFVRIPLITGAVGAVGYGHFVVITSLFPFVTLVAMAIQSAARVEISERPRRARATMGALRVLGVRGVGLARVLAGIVAALGPRLVSSELAHLTAAALAIVALALLFTPSSGAMEAYGHTALAHLTLATNTIVSIPLLVIGFALTKSVWIAVLSSAVGVVVPGLLAAIWLRARSAYRAEPPGRATPRERRTLYRLVGSMTGWSVTSMMIYAFDPLIVAGVAGAVAAGSYGAAGRLLIMVLIMGEGLNALLTVRFSRLRAAGDPGATRAALRRFSTLMALGALLLATIYVLVGPTLTGLLSHGQVPAPISLYVAMGISGWLTVATLPFAAALSGPEAAGFRARVGLVWGAINLGTSVLLGLAIGMLGPVVASIVCNAAMYVTLALAARRKPFLLDGRPRPLPVSS